MEFGPSFKRKVNKAIKKIGSIKGIPIISKITSLLILNNLEKEEERRRKEKSKIWPEVKESLNEMQVEESLNEMQKDINEGKGLGGGASLSMGSNEE